MNRILICDDHSLMREALSLRAARIIPNAYIVQCEDFNAAWRAAEEKALLCLCDLGMPDASPMDGISNLLAIQPDLTIIAVTGMTIQSELQQFIDLGLKGIIPKATDTKIVEAAIQLVLSGGVYLPIELMSSANRPVLDAKPVSGFNLTPTQNKVLSLMCAGKTNKEIAKVMKLSPSTVKTHTDNIFARMSVRNRTEACLKFHAQNGFDR